MRPEADFRLQAIVGRGVPCHHARKRKPQGSMEHSLRASVRGAPLQVGRHQKLADDQANREPDFEQRNGLFPFRTTMTMVRQRLLSTPIGRTSRGDLPLALGLGIILLALALLINAQCSYCEQRRATR